MSSQLRRENKDSQLLGWLCSRTAHLLRDPRIVELLVQLLDVILERVAAQAVLRLVAFLLHLLLDSLYVRLARRDLILSAGAESFRRILLGLQANSLGLRVSQPVLQVCDDALHQGLVAPQPVILVEQLHLRQVREIRPVRHVDAIA